MSPSTPTAAAAVQEAAHRQVSARPVPLASLAGTGLSDRFCYWRGRSGRRYVFSVYDRADQAAHEADYTDAVVIEAQRSADGSRRAVRVGYTGSLPGLSETAWRDNSQRAATETHVHLLAASNSERRALLFDLCGPGEAS